MSFQKLTIFMLAMMLGVSAFDYESYIKTPTLFSPWGTSENVHNYLFHQYTKEFNKVYDNLETFKYRFKIFIDNLYFIKSFNDKNDSSYILGVNEYADLSHDEFVDTYLNKNFQHVANNVDKEMMHNAKYPDSVDWRAKGAVNPIRDQGQCGSCYAFSSIGALEAAYYIKNGMLPQFSEQQIVDCSTGNSGCDGGYINYVFKYAKSNMLCSRSEYPYIAKAGTCKKVCNTYNNSKIADFKGVPCDELSLTNAIAITPVAVAIEADKQVFQFYRSGVFDNKACGENIDHAVLAVGYGHDDNVGKDYYIVRNSWGPKWGENGYIRIFRNSSSTSRIGMCGIAKMTLYPVY